MNLERWKEYEVPDYEGVIDASGNAFAFMNECLSPGEPPDADRFLSVEVLASHELFGGQYRVRCGEATAHGSIGVIVLERAESGDAVWSFVAHWSDPFDQIEVKGSYVLVLSTSGAVFRFQPELEDVTLSIP